MMRFHQGYFGATTRGHDLLVCDPAQRERFLRILDRTDLQGVLPAGVTVESYVTAFRAEDDFVFMRISLDRSASRSGMMFSHVLLARVDSVKDLHSIAPLVAALESERPPHLEISDFEYHGQDVTNPNASSSSNGLANAILAKRDKPPIWPDAGDFIAAIDQLWQTAWPELRMHLTFSMALSPEDAHLRDYAVLYVPESQVFRWAGFSIIAKNNLSAFLEPGAAALAGGPTSISLQELAVEVSWPPKNLSDLRDIATLQQQLNHVEVDPREEIRSLRFLCHLAPAKDVASNLKDQIIQRVRQALPAATLEDLLACRNLRMDCILDQDSLWEGVKNRVNDLFGTGFSPTASVSYLEFLKKVEKETCMAWKRAIQAGLDGAFRAFFQSRASNVFQWISAAPELANLLFDAIPQTEAAEASLESALPGEMEEATLTSILSALASRDLPHLRAKCLATYLSVDRAFDWELSTKVHASALSSLCNLYSAAVVIEQTVRSSDRRLIPMAKQILQENPDLVFQADLGAAGWKHLLKNMKGIKLHIPRGVGFSHLQQQMLSDIASDKRDDELTTTLGTFGFFDLSEFAGEPSVWTALPGELLNDFVDASMFGSVRRLSRGELELQQLVPPLKARLSDRATAMGVIRTLGVGNEIQQVRLFAVLTAVTEEDFRMWYASVMVANRQLLPEVARALGDLISERGWKSGAEQITNDYLSYRRSDLVPALLSIKPLLGMSSRFKLMFAGNIVTPQDFVLDDLWTQLETVLVERLPSGPQEHALWSKSKGDDGDLLTSGSGREKWHHALGLVRNGKKGAPVLDRLVTEVRNLHYNDPSINWFYQNLRQLRQSSKGW